MCLNARGSTCMATIAAPYVSRKLTSTGVFPMSEEPGLAESWIQDSGKSRGICWVRPRIYHPECSGMVRGDHALRLFKFVPYDTFEFLGCCFGV